eukprot:9474433-Pyramimonas_sp.AAC.1
MLDRLPETRPAAARGPRCRETGKSSPLPLRLAAHRGGHGGRGQGFLEGGCLLEGTCPASTEEGRAC